MTASRWLKLSAGTLALLILIAAATRFGQATSGASVVQDSTPSSPPPPSAALLHRLAESADAFRTGSTVYLLVSDSLPYDVVGGFTSIEQARAAYRGRDHSYHIYPVQTAPDVRGQAMTILPGCYKNDITTRWVCPVMPTMRALRLSDVQDIEVTYRLRGGREPVSVRLSADSVSAMIFTLDAFDRFIVPYYTKLFGPERADQMRDSMLTFAKTAEPTGH